MDAGQGDLSVAIGLALWRNGVLKVKTDHAKKLFCTKNPIVASLRASPRELQNVIGLWNWALLLRRPALSVLFHVYTFMIEAQPDRSRRLPDSVVTELSILLDLFPLLYADLSRPLASRVYASDVSEDGIGIVYSDLSIRDL